MFFFFFKQKTSYEMRISDVSADVCSSDLESGGKAVLRRLRHGPREGYGTVATSRHCATSRSGRDRRRAPAAPGHVSRSCRLNRLVGAALSGSHADRKIDSWGIRVSDGVGIGGRLIVENKKNIINRI